MNGENQVHIGILFCFFFIHIFSFFPISEKCCFGIMFFLGKDGDNERETIIVVHSVRALI